jgi:hypothetical protein
MHTEFLGVGGSPREGDYFEGLGVDGKTVLKMDLQEAEWEGTDWTALTEDTDRWWAVVNTSTNLRVS